MKLQREYLIITGLLFLLLFLTVVAGLFQGKSEEIPPLSSNSNASDGARALRLWLSESGYVVSNQSARQFQIPEGTDAVLILEPTLDDGFSSAEWESLDQWLEEGGLLFLASDDIWWTLSESPLQVDTEFTAFQESLVFPAAPIFRTPPMVQPARLTTRHVLIPSPDSSPGDRGFEQVHPLLSTSEGLIAVRLNHRRGSVILIAGSSFLTNQGLKDPGNAALALNLFSFIPTGSSIWIDEWHHGERGASQGYGPEAWLTDTPAGLAVLFSVGVIFLGLLLAGRPFGRPVPLPEEQTRRHSLEYVTALANLNRRAGHSRALMLYYHDSLKRAYGRRYRLDPGLPDPVYVDQLVRCNPALDGPALLHLLQRLDQTGFTDLEIVQFAREAAGWLSGLDR